MEIKEAIEEIKKGDGRTTSIKRGEAILTICQAICDGYTLFKADELEGKINNVRDEVLNTIETYEANDVLDIVDRILVFLKEACL